MLIYILKDQLKNKVVIYKVSTEFQQIIIIIYFEDNLKTLKRYLLFKQSI